MRVVKREPASFGRDPDPSPPVAQMLDPEKSKSSSDIRSRSSRCRKAANTPVLQLADAIGAGADLPKRIHVRDPARRVVVGGVGSAVDGRPLDFSGVGRPPRSASLLLRLKFWRGRWLWLMFLLLWWWRNVRLFVAIRNRRRTTRRRRRRLGRDDERSVVRPPPAPVGSRRLLLLLLLPQRSTTTKAATRTRVSGSSRSSSSTPFERGRFCRFDVPI